MTSIKAFLKTILYKPLFNALIFLVWLLPGDNVGWAIIILTVLIRFALLPSTWKAAEAQKKMQSIQGEVEKIKEQYKDDKKLQTEKTMALYQEHKVNPLGSCLVLLIQAPILIILYYVFRSGLDISHFNLLYSFTPRPDALNPYFFGINLNNPNLYLAIAAGLLQFVQSKQLMPPKNPNKPVGKDTASQIQNLMSGQFTYLMPVFTVIIAMKLPAALAIYWAVTSLFSVVQQYIFDKTYRGSKQKVVISVRSGNE